MVEVVDAMGHLQGMICAELLVGLSEVLWGPSTYLRVRPHPGLGSPAGHSRLSLLKSPLGQGAPPDQVFFEDFARLLSSFLINKTSDDFRYEKGEQDRNKKIKT